MNEMNKKRSWSYLVMGIVLLVLGAYIIANPAIVSAGLALMLIVSSFTVGFSKIMESMSSNGGNHKVASIVLGVINLAFGFFFIFNFFTTVIVVPIIAGIWLFAWGIGELISSAATRKANRNWFFNLLIGVLSMFLGAYMMFNPLVAMRWLGFYFGFYLIIIGIIGIVAFLIPGKKEN